MRKLLLMGAAVLGITIAGAAVPTFAADQMAGSSMGPGAMPPFLGGNNMFDSQGGPLPNNAMAPKPGEVTIHLNGRVVWLGGFEGDSGSDYAGYHHSIYQQGGYFRLYPGVDGMATNGLRYGAIVEIRQNMAGVKVGGGGDTLYVRRAAAYLGTDELGIVRLGQDDGPFSQMDGGVTTFQFTDGAWNGDAPGMFPGSLWIAWPFWTGTGSEYTLDKIVYFSPQIAGFDLGLAYIPSQNSFNTYFSCDAPASTNCNNLSSAPGFTSARYKNMYEIMGRYRGKFNGLGVYGIAGYSGSDVVGNSTGVQPYKGFSVGDVGLALDYAGFSFGGNVLFGDYNRQVALMPKGADSALSWVIGATYSTGPMVVGVQYFHQKDAGSWNGTTVKSNETNQGVAVSGQYNVAPGLAMIATYLWGQRNQPGYDYLASAVGTANNTVHMQTFMLSAHVSW